MSTEAAGTALADAMHEAGCPMGAVATTPRYFLAQRYGRKFLGLSRERQQEVVDAVQRRACEIVGCAVPGRVAPSSVGQRYA